MKQLSSSQLDQPIRSATAREYEARRRKADKDGLPVKKLTIVDCTRLIIELAEHSSVHMSLDALDECEEDTRYELFEAFEDILQRSPTVVKIFVSSRDDVDIVSITWQVLPVSMPSSR